MTTQEPAAPSVTDVVTLDRSRAEKLINYAKIRRELCYDPRPASEWFHELNEQGLLIMETMTDEDVAPLAASPTPSAPETGDTGVKGGPLPR